MALFVRGERMRIRLSGVLVAVGELGRGNGGKHEARPEALRESREQPGAEVRNERLVGQSGGAQLVAPELRMRGFGLRKLQEQVLANVIRLCLRERGIQGCAVQLISKVLAIALDIRVHPATPQSALIEGARSTQAVCAACEAGP